MLRIVFSTRKDGRVTGKHTLTEPRQGASLWERCCRKKEAPSAIRRAPLAYGVDNSRWNGSKVELPMPFSSSHPQFCSSSPASFSPLLELA
eukprot:scaffold1070_cov245-Pinguiococcus_pyrenoidosus.AAC.28